MIMTAISMTDKLQKISDRTAEPSPQPGNKARGWAALLAWLLVIWAFAFVFAPWLQNNSAAVRTLANYIKASGIDASAIYYTEVDEVGEADLMIRDTFRFYLPQQEKEEQ
jgi:hypothetical protein